MVEFSQAKSHEGRGETFLDVEKLCGTVPGIAGHLASLASAHPLYLQSWDSQNHLQEFLKPPPPLVSSVLRTTAQAKLFSSFLLNPIDVFTLCFCLQIVSSISISGNLSHL